MGMHSLGCTAVRADRKYVPTEYDIDEAYERFVESLQEPVENGQWEAERAMYEAIHGEGSYDLPF